MQHSSKIVVMAKLKPFNNLHQSSVIAVMEKLQLFKYFTSIHELSSWHRFLFLQYSRNRFKVAMRPYDVREVVESFGAGQVMDSKDIWKYFFCFKIFGTGQVKDSKNIWKCDHCALISTLSWIAFQWIIKTHQVRLRCC